jgi:hypothetical protein
MDAWVDADDLAYHSRCTMSPRGSSRKLEDAAKEELLLPHLIPTFDDGTTVHRPGTSRRWYDGT